MGIIGALLPLTLFSGEEQTGELIEQAVEIGVIMLIVLAVMQTASNFIVISDWL